MSLPISSEDAVAGRGFVSAIVDSTTPRGRSRRHAVVLAIDDPDVDGLTTAYERASGLDPLSADDAGADPDGDNLRRAAEEAQGTRGDLADSDGDGLNDDAEPTSDPRSSSSWFPLDLLLLHIRWSGNPCKVM